MKKSKDRIEVVVVDEEEIPDIVTTQFNKLHELSAKYDEALEKAEVAKESAENANKESAGFLHKKDAIEALQKSQLDTAEAVIQMTDVQRLTLEYQEEITKITQYLFSLGVSNIAANRSVVRQLKMKLEGASEEELSELARQEILNVVRQLKAQEDILEKQTVLSSKVRDHEKRLKQQENKSFDLDDRIDSTDTTIKENEKKHLAREARQDKALKEHNRKIEERIAKDEEHDHKIEEQVAKDKEHDRRIEERVAKDEEQDRRIEEQVTKDKEHDRRLDEQVAKDKEHDRILEERVKRDLEHDAAIAKLNHRIKELEQSVVDVKRQSFNKYLGMISFVMAAVGLILAIVQFIR